MNTTPQEISDRKLYLLLLILSISVVVLAAGLYASAAGEKSPLSFQKEEHTLSVSGSASSFVTPDRASVSIGVLTQEKTSREASEKNAAVMTAVINELKNLGLADRDIRTSFISIQPVYSYPEGRAPVIVGYSASNNVQVTTDMFDRLGDIVDRSVGAGANQVGGISFSVSEEKQKQLRDELVVKAVNDAGEKARKLAQSLNVEITGVKTSSISEEGAPSPFPVAAIAEKAQTPVQPGESKVTLSVQVAYIIE